MNNKIQTIDKKSAVKASHLSILDKYVNNNLKLIPFNIRKLELGRIKYLPPVAKEWKNSIYLFNKNNLKNFPIYDLNINYIIKSYFNSHFDYLFIDCKYITRRLRHISMNKIFVSKAEIKHTNFKALITIYTYNREKQSLLKKLIYFDTVNKDRMDSILSLFIKHVSRDLEFDINRDKCEKFFKSGLTNAYLLMKLLVSKGKNLFNNDLSSLLFEKYKALFFEDYSLLRRYKLKLNLNKYKFEEKFLYLLSSLVSKYYNKKVEFNIVNLKYITFNSDISTYILTKRLKDRNTNIIEMMNTILNKAKLPEVNRILEKSSNIKNVDPSLAVNKYKNTNINYALNSLLGVKNNFDLLLNEIYNNNLGANKDSINKFYGYARIYEIIFNSIKYKNIGGVRLEVRGRLTKRYRADRALYKLRLKGGLKNMDSSYKGLSSAIKRGYQNSNVEYSIFTSKRRVGSYAVKG
jgi:hypothetical protein